MRRSATAILLALIAPATALAAVSVPIDQSRKVFFSGQAANVVVGNPGIADVSIIDSRTVLVTGKRFGTTNIVVMDALGRTLFDSEILISAGEGARVSVYRGVRTENYSCSPYCQSTEQSSGIGTAPSVTPTAATITTSPAPATGPAAAMAR